MQKRLTKKELDREFNGLSAGWKFNATRTSITLIINHTSYVDALIFLSKVIVHAEVSKQLPQITLSKDKIKISLSGTSELGLTNNVFIFAKLIDGLSLSTVIKRW